MKVFKNPEKEKHHGPMGLLPQHPARIGLFGPPGSGKRNLCLNLIRRIQKSSKPFQTITVLHGDGDTQEYSILDDQDDFRIVTEIPTKDDFNMNKKNLLIIDEIPWTLLKTDSKSALERLFNFVSTHRSVTIIAQGQNVFDIPVSCRRAMTHIVMWPSIMADMVQFVNRMVGFDVRPYFKFCGPHDSIVVDMAAEPDKRIRKNWFTVLR